MDADYYGTIFIFSIIFYEESGIYTARLLNQLPRFIAWPSLGRIM